MTVIFTWAFISACVSLMLIYFFVSLSSKEVKHSRRRSTGTSVIWAGISLLVLFLTACSGLTSSNKNVPPTNTPLAPTPTAHSTTTPDTPATSSTDWTTYHANKLRTGYIPGTPDPHNLSKIWSTQLDGSVYAEPLVVGNRKADWLSHDPAPAHRFVGKPPGRVKATELRPSKRSGH